MLCSDRPPAKRVRPPSTAMMGIVDDAHEAASFLLQLKHRPVTPDILHDQVGPTRGNVATCGRGDVAGAASFLGTVRGRCPRVPTADSWEWLLASDDLLVSIEDRDLVPDVLLLAMAQLKPCRLTEADRVGCYKTRELGFVGMCCKHCGGQPGFGRYYPNTVRSLAQTTTSQTIIKHIAKKCQHTPPEVREALLHLQMEQAFKDANAPAGRPRYGSRKVFFQRMWERLHAMKGCNDGNDNDSQRSSTPTLLSHGSDVEDDSLERGAHGDWGRGGTKRKRKTLRY